MSKQDLDIMIACGRNSERYVDFLIKSIEKTESGNYNFNLLLGINDNQTDIDYISKIDTKYKKSLYDCRTSGTFSHGHGEALDILQKAIKTEFCVVADCDIAFLYKGWDEYLIGEIANEENVAAIGAEYDGDKYYKFPNLVMSVFKSDIIKKCKVSWEPLPINEREIKVEDDNASDFWGRPIGSVVCLDTGWQLCHNLKMCGYEGKYMPLVKAKDKENRKFMTDGMRGEEHVYKGDPIITHIGRSFTRSFDNDIVVKWRSRVNEWLSI